MVPRQRALPLLLLLCWLLNSATAVRPIQEEALAGSSEEEQRGLPDEPKGPRQEPLGFKHRTMEELVVQRYGYPLEEHFVTTQDGYVLGVYRLPHGATDRSAGEPPPQRRPPVLLQHGLLDSSAAWVLNDPDQSLGFILADSGWDVWLGNSRGNAFSRNHTGIDPSTAAFWTFTWDDMAAYDLPAVVGYILEQTGYEQLAYVGHSQGTTQMFAALSAQPELRRQVSLFAALAPAVYMRWVSSVPFQILAGIQMDRLINLLGSPEFLPSRKATADLFGEVCKASPDLCVSVLTAISGFNAANTNLSRLPDYVAYAPSGTSVMNMAHWAQALRKARWRAAPLFQKYDYGSECLTPRGLPRTCNMRMYGSEEPPSYDLTVIDTPLAIFSGGQDKLADPLDVETLLEALPLESLVHSQVEPSYEHLDFTWGVDAKDALYPALLALLRQYEPPPPPARL